MQILIEINENLEETLKKVLVKISEGYTFCKTEPKFRIVYENEELPMSDEDVKDYNHQKFLENMYKHLPKSDY